MSTFETVVCALLHTPIEPTPIDRSVEKTIDYGGSDRIPGIDFSLGSNIAYGSFNGDEEVARIRGRAYGIANWFRNFASSVDWRVRFNYFLDPDSVVAGELYRFSAGVHFDGLFDHFAAVSSVDTDHQPPAATQSIVRVSFNITELGASERRRSIAEGELERKRGEFQPVGGGRSGIDVHNELVRPPPPPALPGSRPQHVVDSDITLGRRFRPSGSAGIYIEVDWNVSIAAVGQHSDVTLIGLDGRRRARVKVLEPQVQKVLLPGDRCFDVLQPRDDAAE